MYFNKTSKYTTWTTQAIECYVLKFPCQSCAIKKYFDSVSKAGYRPFCHMKQSTIEIVKNIGPPTEDDIYKVFKDEIEEIKKCHKYHNIIEK